MSRAKKASAPGDGRRAVVYLRVSREDSDRKHGLDVQREYCDEYVASHGYEVIATFVDDGISGVKGIEERPGLREAIALCDAHAVDVLVCWAQDRVSRSVSVFDQIRERLKKLGVRLETFKENTDFTRDESMFMGDIHAAVSAEERRRITARLYGGRRVRSRRDGLGSGPLPLGYALSADGEIIVDEVWARLIRLIFDLRRDHSMRHTVAILNERGYRTPRFGKLWTLSHLQSVVRNETLYKTGERSWDGVVSVKRWPILVQH